MKMTKIGLVVAVVGAAFLFTGCAKKPQPVQRPPQAQQTAQTKFGTVPVTRDVNK